MTRGELKAAMKAEQARLRAAMKETRARTEAALSSDPRVQRARQKKRRNRLIALSLLLLLLLLLRCDGPGGPGDPIVIAPHDAGVPAPKPPPKPVVKAPQKKTVIAPKPVDRPDFDTPTRPAAAWVDEFRLQVAARAPRLSACFVGTSRPGTLRWTTLISLQTGAVGSHEFESMGVAADLSKEQLECLQGVLSKPPYRLMAPGSAEGLPERVSLVLEF